MKAEAPGPQQRPFHRSADVYDIIYQWLPYAEQADRIAELVRERRPEARSLLEVACGTGRYLVELQRHFSVIEGLDVEAAMLDIARERLPDVPLHEGDMRTFDVGRTFDVVVCLFSSIGYMTTREDLTAALRNMRRHLVPGGVMVIDPWFTPDAWIDGHVGGSLERGEDVVVGRLSHGTVDGTVSVMDAHHLVGRQGRGVEHYVERHVMGLFTDEQYVEVFGELGLDAERLDDLAWMDRNRYVAVAK
jgi:ubiquinone/menaquinone biosynthesis C-methylase UbiE